MDLKKAYGVEQALGRSLAEHDREEGLRKVQTPEEFRHFLESLPTVLPRELVTQWAERIEDGEWRKARSKLLLGAQVAKGQMRVVPDHEVERGGVANRGP